MLQQLSDWLSDSYITSLLSDTTHFSTWLVIPLSQSVHILAVAMVMISVAMLNLRLLQITGTNRSFADWTSRLMPWVWGGLIMLLLTGTLQTLAEPSRELMNGTFRLKMIMLLIVVVISAAYQFTSAKNPRYWDITPDRQRIGKMLATASLILWCAILAAGRLLAYFDLKDAL